MSTVGLVDTHAHLMDAAFDADRDLVVERAASAGVDGMLLVGYDASTSCAAIDLAGRLPRCGASVGIHPNSADEATQADFDLVASLARRPEVLAIGETGIDYYRRHTPPDRQRAAFEWHLRLAEELSLPVIVHNRDADGDVADALEASAARRRSGVVGVLHCFSSTDRAYLERMLRAGLYVSFAGTLTFKRASELRAMAERVPPERLLVETDCPYLAPVPHRGRRNEPAFARETAACLASVTGLSYEALTEQLSANTARVLPALMAHARAA